MRDLYAVGDDLLIVTTDRISAFDHILPTPIPGKGAVLTAMSAFWFDFLSGIVPHHLITTDVDAMGPLVSPHRDLLRGRTMLVRRAQRIDAECVVRGYITGSGWADYRRTGAICGIAIRPGMAEAEAFDEPLFTPATKAETGHDENIDFATLAGIVGRDVAEQVRDLSIRIYEAGRDHARVARDHPRRHEVRVRVHRWPHRAHRRGADPRLVALLGRRDVAGRHVAAVVRQADRPRPPHRVRLGPRAADPGAAGVGRRAHRRALSRGAGAAHRVTAGSSVPILVTSTSWRARITVRLAPGVNDPQGNAVADSLRSMGHADVRDVRVGRVVDLVIEAPDEGSARARVDELCRALLANPVIETWETDVRAAGLEGADG